LFFSVPCVLCGGCGAEVGSSVIEAVMVYVVAEHVVGDGDDGAVDRDFCC